MAIYRLLEQHAFDADDVRLMTAAYEDSLRVLQLDTQDDLVTEIIAKKIIEVLQTGERDPTVIGRLARAHLGTALRD